MTEFYLGLAAFLAFSLNQSSRILRVLGTLTAASALGLIAWSIVLANLDGTFAAVAWPRPLVLNAQALVATAAALFLLWAAWTQASRRVATALPLRNTPAGFGRVSRYAHWVTGLLVLVLMPIGLFTVVLPVAHPERGEFVAAHQALGLVVLVLVVLRLGWLQHSPAPAIAAELPAWRRRLAGATHLGLYALLLGFPLTGVLLTLARGEALAVFGWSVATGPAPGLAAVVAALHNWVLPVGFHLAVFAHLAGVVSHRGALRRMLR